MKRYYIRHNRDYDSPLFVEYLHNYTKLEYYTEFLRIYPQEFYDVNKNYIEDIIQRVKLLEGSDE